MLSKTRNMMTIDEFLSKGVEARNQNNDFTHHECCDVWTTRASVKKRGTHITKASWRAIINAAGGTLDGKEVIRAFIERNGRSEFVLVNQACTRSNPE